MRAVALAVVFFALTWERRRESDPFGFGVLSWGGVLSFLGFLVCVIGGW